MSIIFQKSGRSDLTLENGRLIPFTPLEISINQLRQLTESNNPIVVDYGDNLQFINLNFKNLSKDNYDGSVNGLKTWFESSEINWSANNFTLIDELGISNTVRLWESSFGMAFKANGLYEISLKFLKE